MTVDLPPQRPEGMLIHQAIQATGRSVRQVSAQAGMSEARWRQIVKGYMYVNSVVSEVLAPAPTLARMAQAVGVTAEQLRDAGRKDAAIVLENMQREADDGSSSAPLQLLGPSGNQADEIDMIYASGEMTATQKLEAIRKVLLLRREAASEPPQRARKAPIPRPKRTTKEPGRA